MKKFFVFLLSLTISLTPTFLWAGAAEKWDVQKISYDSSSRYVNVEAKKITQQAANSSIYKVNVNVAAETLGATLKRMLWIGAATASVTALIEAVGWVIDEGSQVIKKPVEREEELPYYDYFWIWTSAASNQTDYIKWGGVSAQQACEAIAYLYPQYGGKIKSVTVTSDTSAICYFNDAKTYYQYVSKRPNTWREEGNPPEPQIVSDAELGNEVIGNGENTTPLSDAIVSAYSPNNPVSDAPAPQETLDALDSANPEPETDPTGDTKPKPNVDTDGDGEPDAYDPEQPSQGEEFTLPPACDWFPAACDFFLVQKADNKQIKQNQKDQLEQDKTFFEKVSDWFDWSQEQPDLDQDEIDIQEPDEFDTSVFSTDRFSVSRQCPVPETHTIALSGVSVDFSFDLSPLCQVLEFARPALVACSYLYAAYIVIGAARNG